MHNTRDKLTSGLNEVPTGCACTGRSKTKDLRWIHGRSKCENVGRHLLGFHKVTEARLICRSPYNSEHYTILPIGLSARTQQRRPQRQSVGNVHTPHSFLTAGSMMPPAITRMLGNPTGRTVEANALVIPGAEVVASVRESSARRTPRMMASTASSRLTLPGGNGWGFSSAITFLSCVPIVGTVVFSAAVMKASVASCHENFTSLGEETCLSLPRDRTLIMDPRL